MIDLAAWNSFYVILGSSAGALTGLQFVVMTLITQKAPPRAEEAHAAFATPTIVHFAAVLLLSALLSAPWQEAISVAWILGFIGVIGVGIYDRRCRENASTNRICDKFSGLDILCPSATGSICHPRPVGISGIIPYDGGAVRGRGCGFAAAVHRHPERMGQRHLPGIVQ